MCHAHGRDRRERRPCAAFSPRQPFPRQPPWPWAFPSAPAPSSVSASSPSSVSVSSASSVPSASDARRPRSPSSVRRPGRVRFARRRAASRQNCIAEADVHVPRDDEPVRRLRRLSGRKEAEGVLFRLHGDGFPNSRARTACASSRLLDRRRVRRRRRVCRGAAHIPRHRNETRKPRAHSRRRPQRLNPLGGGHAPKNIRGRKRPRRSLAG